jgi:hypothetical protein
VLAVFAISPILTGKLVAQEADGSIRTRLVLVQADQKCHPAWLKFLSFGRQPKDAVLAQVTVENTSDKVITAVKMDWKVYAYPDRTNMWQAFCGPQRDKAEVLASGSTPLYEIGVLVPKGMCNIAIDPVPAPPPMTPAVTTNVTVDRPMITAADLKDLRPNDPPPKIKYVVVVYLSQIRYDDGSSWQANVGTTETAHSELLSHRVLN